jgi:hypothetical protein
MARSAVFETDVVGVPVMVKRNREREGFVRFSGHESESC